MQSGFVVERVFDAASGAALPRESLVFVRSASDRDRITCLSCRHGVVEEISRRHVSPPYATGQNDELDAFGVSIGDSYLAGWVPGRVIPMAQYLRISTGRFPVTRYVVSPVAADMPHRRLIAHRL